MEAKGLLAVAESSNAEGNAVQMQLVCEAALRNNVPSLQDDTEPSTRSSQLRFNNVELRAGKQQDAPAAELPVPDTNHI